jgi:PAS domain S-box-containing protein
VDIDPILDEISDSVIIRDLEGRILSWNRVSETLYGYTKTQASGQALHALLQSDHPTTVESLETHLKANGSWDGELSRMGADGRARRVEVKWRLRDDRIIEHGRDLTALNALERASRETSLRYNNLFQAMAAAFWELDFSEVRNMMSGLFQSGVSDFPAWFRDHPEFIDAAIAATRVVDVNDKCVEMFAARDREAMVGGNVDPYWPQESRHVFAQSLIASATRAPSFTTETRVATLDGRKLDVLFTVCWPKGHHGRGTVLVGNIDISERVAAQKAVQQLQTEFAHASRLSVLGELVASIAHEVNQPLAAIAANGAAATRWLSRATPDLDEVRAINTHMISDAKRAADIIARVRTMAANQTPVYVRIDLNQAIEDALSFLEHELQAHGAHVSVNLSTELKPVNADRVQIQQIVVNLVLNALQEMARTPTEQRAGPRLEIRSFAQDGAAQVEISDNGPGIKPENLDRLFDSFFTTKSSGLGMGLSICKTIIEAHGGRIWAQNRPEGGACFAFCLPLA